MAQVSLKMGLSEFIALFQWHAGKPALHKEGEGWEREDSEEGEKRRGRRGEKEKKRKEIPDLDMWHLIILMLYVPPHWPISSTTSQEVGKKSLNRMDELNPGRTHREATRTQAKSCGCSGEWPLSPAAGTLFTLLNLLRLDHNYWSSKEMQRRSSGQQTLSSKAPGLGEAFV